MDAAGDHGPILVVDDDAALAEMLQLVLIKDCLLYTSDAADE